jgi:sugar phosphate permease
MQAVDTTMKRTNKRFHLLIILLLTITVAYFDRVNVTVLIADKTFLQEMGVFGDPAKAGLLMTFFLIAYGVGNIVLSGIGDYFGPRKTMTIAMIGWFGSMLFSGFAPALGMMLFARFLLGLGEGLHFPMMNTFCRPWYPNHEKGKANAVWFIGTSLAPAIGMPVFSWLLSTYSWHYVFFMCAAVGLIPLYFIWFHSADTPREHKTINQAEIDYIEAGLNNTDEQAAAKVNFREMLAQNLSLITKNRIYWVMVVYYSIHNIVWWGLMTWLPTYLKAERGFSWSQMGFLASAPFILGIGCKLLAGWASDRIGRRAPFCILAMAGTAIMLYLSATSTSNILSAVYICIGMAVITPGAPLSMTMLQEMLPKRAMSLGTGLLNGVSYVCASLSPAILGYIMAKFGGFSSALILLVGTCFIGFICAVILTFRKY